MQKEKLKTQKGITLIALIITIIVMLILVAVTINVALKGGLFKTAKDTAKKTEQAVKDEMEMLQYQYEIASAKGETTAEDFTEYVLDTKYSGLKIGDYVNYDELSNETKTHTPDATKGAGSTQTSGDSSIGYKLDTPNSYETENLEWRVLGVNEKGQLELISDKSTKSTLYLANDIGYLNVEENLNTFCNDLYGKGRYAENARSLNIEDINKLINYDPSTQANDYGKEWQYKFSDESTKIQSSQDMGATWKDTSNTTFRQPTETKALSSSNHGVNKVYYTHYSYSISDYTNNETILDMMTGDGDQWLASSCINCFDNAALFCIRVWYNDHVNYYNLFNSYNSYSYTSYHLRPVVILASDIKLGEKIDNVWQLK